MLTGTCTQTLLVALPRCFLRVGVNAVNPGHSVSLQGSPRPDSIPYQIDRKIRDIHNGICDLGRLLSELYHTNPAMDSSLRRSYESLYCFLSNSFVLASSCGPPFVATPVFQRDCYEAHCVPQASPAPFAPTTILKGNLGKSDVDWSRTVSEDQERIENDLFWVFP